MTLEQRLHISKCEHILPGASKETLVQLIVSLQTHNFALQNNVVNLIKSWPKPPVPTAPNTTDVVQFRSGISSEIKG
jgi:hypothetical protein